MSNHKISILSYNLYCLPWIATMFKPSTCPHSYARTSAFLKHIPNFDILGLQEVWSPRYQQVEAYAKEKGFHVVGSGHASLQSMLGLRLFGGGLMIMSKYPIDMTRELIFDKGVASDGFVRKGILYAKVRIGSSYLHVFNTHMQASYGCEFAEHDPYALIRKNQLQKIVDFIAKVTHDDDHPIVMMGDFNVNAIHRPDTPTDSREYKEMLLELEGNGLFSVLDLHKAAHKGHPITNTGKGVVNRAGAKGGQRLDFVLEMRRTAARSARVQHHFPHAEILPFAIEGEEYTHISDHFAAHVVMEVAAREEFEPDGASVVPTMTVQLTL